MKIFIWDKTTILAIIASSVEEAREVAKREGIVIEGLHNKAIELTEITPALIIYKK